MKKFRNTVTGEVVVRRSDLYYEDSEGFGAIPKRFIENSDDWEELSYEVLSFQYSSGEIITLREKGKYIISSASDDEFEGCSLKEQLEDYCEIRSVKRLSDGEVFTVGDVVTWGADTESNFSMGIESFSIDEGELEIKYANCIYDGVRLSAPNFRKFVHTPLYTTYDGVDRFEYQEEHWVINDVYQYALKVCSLHLEGSLTEPSRWKIFSSEEKALEYVESVRPKPLFTTEDGKDIFEGDTYWCVNTAPHLWNPYEQTAKKRTHLPSNVKAFTTKELLYKFILLNKPLLSLDDLLSVWSEVGRYDALFSTSPLFLSFKKLAKSKL